MKRKIVMATGAIVLVAAALVFSGCDLVISLFGGGLPGISGKVIDAQSGNAVQGVTVKLHDRQG
ncbi:MAG TPA: hypothetical protein VMV68_02665 [Spirochaetia bacterium]|nr:hypothetical protein [Spirochaetia bacterium]